MRIFKKKKNDSDFDKIKVTSNGTFYMESKDIFRNKKKSLELIKKLRKSIDNYKKTKNI